MLDTKEKGILFDQRTTYCPNCGRTSTSLSAVNNGTNFMESSKDIMWLKTELSKTQRSLQVTKAMSVVLTSIFILVLFFQISQIAAFKFQFYYAAKCKQRFGVDDLLSYLNRWRWTEGAYIRNEFDCSEMSAYLEWRLENEGYNTIIVIGNCPWEPAVKHVWLLVEESEGHFIPVEATQYKIISQANPYIDLYYEYDFSFDTIYDALNHNYDEFNWWENYEEFDWREKPV